MGVAESKILAEGLLQACERAEAKGNSRLEDGLFWRNEAIRKAAKTVGKYIPSDILSRPRRSNLKKAISQSCTRVAIPQVVEDLQQKREVLFPKAQDTLEEGQRRDLQIHHSNLPTCPTSSINHLARYYELVIECEKDVYLNTLRLRILYVAFYVAKQQLEPGSQYEYYSITPFLAEAVMHTLPHQQSTDDIEKKLRTWIGYGERYSLLAGDLGGLGALYILPDLGGEYIWRKELPKSTSNPGRISMIRTLKEQNIHVEAEGLHASAQAEVDHIVHDLLEAFQDVISHYWSGTQTFQTRQDQGSQRADESSQADASSEPRSTVHASSTGRTGFTVSPGHAGTIGLLEDRHTNQVIFSGSDNTQNALSTPQHISNMSDVQEPSRFDPATIDQSHQILGEPDYLDHTTMTPANYPQVFPLPPATMMPFNHPQLFLDQYTSMSPMNYPQVFPFQGEVHSSIPRLEQQRLFVRGATRSSQPFVVASG
ncbi:hypothetical protein AnigIFM63604_004099 [Aspergillus niger]|uniref:Uncharacterized protein n=1 Tax=Aspergillus niger TaxID=5061 RepID=A0A9W6AEY8_ASPNG|nr:hypothetical protein AnigIFM63604_004099 [Aspergillus niger]